jgi:hypothetical protein
VYPETKGVPLEEMDEVFGEGMVFRVLRTQKSEGLRGVDIIELRQELLENESEATSLVQDQMDYFSTDDELARRRSRSSGGEEGWLPRFLGRLLYPGAGRYASVSQEHPE